MKKNNIKIKKVIKKVIMSEQDKYQALWRASAHEAVPYTDDFPECLLVLPEFWDGSLSKTQGNAKTITTSINIQGKRGMLMISDDGLGIRNRRRLLSWAASKAVDNIHRNGHGIKKALTKWMREHPTAVWSIQWRNKGQNVQKASPPFLGYDDTLVEEDEEDQTTLFPSGTRFTMEFDTSILGKAYENESIETLKEMIKEIVLTRYRESVLDRIEFIIELENEKGRLRESSKQDNWHSFEFQLEKHLEQDGFSKLYCNKIENREKGYQVELSIYQLDINGQKPFALKKNFPTYGPKNMPSSRVLLYLDERMIEAIPIYQLLDMDSNHNDLNSYKAIARFIPITENDFEKLPIPCTTKVSMYRSDPGFIWFKNQWKTIFLPLKNGKKRIKEEQKEEKLHVIIDEVEEKIDSNVKIIAVPKTATIPAAATKNAAKASATTAPKTSATMPNAAKISEKTEKIATLSLPTTSTAGSVTTLQKTNSGPSAPVTIPTDTMLAINLSQSNLTQPNLTQPNLTQQKLNQELESDLQKSEFISMHKDLMLFYDKLEHLTLEKMEQKCISHPELKTQFHLIKQFMNYF